MNKEDIIRTQREIDLWLTTIIAEIHRLRADNEGMLTLLKEIHADEDSVYWHSNITLLLEQQARRAEQPVTTEAEELRAENQVLVKSLEFHEEQWMNTVKELTELRSQIKALDPGCAERGCVARDMFE